MYNRIWIFDVSPGWSYCGGGIVVIAASFEGAVYLLKEHKDEYGKNDLEGHNFYQKVEDIPKLEKIYYTYDPTKFFYRKDEGWDEWVLVGDFVVENEHAKVILVSYNYA